MSEVLDFKPKAFRTAKRSGGGDRLSERFGAYDAAYLELVTEWRVNRAKAEIVWARSDHADRASPDGPPPNLRHLRKMQEAETDLAQADPGSMELAAAMLCTGRQH